MSDIKVERKPNDERLDSQEVKSWPIWTKEKSEFPWTYDTQETCYFLEGDVVVTPDGGEPVDVVHLGGAQAGSQALQVWGLSDS